MVDTREGEQPVGSASGAGPAATPVPSRTLRRAGFVALAAALLVAALGIATRIIHERQVAAWTDAQATPTVSVIAPERGVTGQETILPGTIKAWYEAPVYARVSGYLKMWYFDYGAHVKKGQLLAEIEAPDLDADLAAAEANLKAADAQVNVRAAEMEFAKTTYERWRDSPKGVVSDQERESKKADYNSGLARYEAAKATVNADQGLVNRLEAFEQFKRVVAPFDGIVTVRNTDIGDLINAGSGAGGGSAPELFRVADVHEMRVFVQVPQRMSAGVRPGLVAQLDLPQYPQKVFKATVATTAEAINLDARTLLVELHAPNPDGLLQPGTFAEVHFELPGNPSVLRIPTSALIFRAQGMQVAVLAPGDRVELRDVTLGRNLGTEVEVLDGLTASDRVIASPSDSLAAGDLVQVEGEKRSGAAVEALAGADRSAESAQPVPEALAPPSAQALGASRN